MTGEGVVLPHEDAEKFDDLLDTLDREMKPKTALARDCLGRIALFMLKLTRGALHEAKALAYRTRHAEAEFDQKRLDEVDHLYSWIGNEPATNFRRLRRSPEGLDRLIEALKGMHDDICHPYGMRWDWNHCDRLHHMLGLRREDLPASRFRAMTDAALGNFHLLDPCDGEGLEAKERRAWASAKLVELLEDEIRGLKAQRESFDHKGLALDRSEAKYRAMFDDSKEGILARKYNAANERAYLRALKEFRELNAMATEVVEDPEVAEELGSFFPEPPEESVAEADVDPTVIEEAPTDRKRRPKPAELLRKRVEKARREASRSKTEGQ